MLLAMLCSMRQLWFCLSFLVVACLLARPATAKPSCGAGGPTGTGSGSAGSGTFKYSVPQGYSPQKAIPLLLALHGDEGTPDYIYSVFKGLQGTSGGAFILVAPKAPFGGGSWYQSTSNHTTFINAVIDKLLKQYNIDQDRIWVTGWSGGATFLGYYAIKRQDILAAVVYHMGGGGGGSYSPPAGSCKIPGRFVIGTADFLYNLAQKQYNTMKQNGHSVKWVELPGVGHKFDNKTLPATWTWLQSKTLCGKTTPGSCGPGPSPSPDAGAPPPPPKTDGGVTPPPPQSDGGTPPPSPAADSGAPSYSDAGPSSPGSDGENLTLRRERPDLLGGCSTSARSNGVFAHLGSLLLLTIVLGAWRRRS
jgi:pimeloyl-ACP methyl ester carboxylesterase